MAFHNFPDQHWQSIRTSNPIESTFGTIRQRGFYYLAKAITGVKFRGGIEITESNQVAA